jgi:hypothetical protein
MNFAGRSGLAALCAALVLLIMPALVSAHGGREVGEYSFTVGFFVEPAYEGEKNGVDLRVETGDEEPVEGVEETLEVEVIYGEDSVVMPLRAVFNTPGRYTADFFPTVAGQYTFRFFGTIGDLAVDESFTSEVDGFNSVQPTEDRQFPVRVASSRELQSAVTGSTDAIAEADEAASAAATRANIALGLGAVGLLAGVGALALSMRKRG